MPYPITFSLNERLRTRAGECLKKLKDTEAYAVGFKTQTLPSVAAFAEAIGPTADCNGTGFSFGTFENQYRHKDTFQRAFGIGIDFDKITSKDDKNEILLKECVRRLPTLEQILASRIGPFVRLIYKSQSCPDDADYIMGRVLLTFERDLSFDECKALSLYLISILAEDFPLADPKQLKLIDLAGGIDVGAIKDPIRWWAGIKHGRTALYINEENPPIPSDILDSWVGAGQQYVPSYRNSGSGSGSGSSNAGPVTLADHLDIDEQTLQVIDVVLRDILHPSGPNSYEDSYRWIKSFVQLVRPRLDDAFEEWLSNSPYRLEAIQYNIKGQLYYTQPMEYTSLKKAIDGIKYNTPDWIEKYFEHTGIYPHFVRGSESLDIYDDDYRMGQHPGEVMAALKALGL